MAIKNPAYGVWPGDDENTGRSFQVMDSSVNVEAAVISRMSKLNAGERESYPATTHFKLINNSDGQVVVTTEDNFGTDKLRWISDYTPCKKDGYNRLCDGQIPACSPYTKGDPKKGYSSTGCKAFKSCIINWRVKKL